MTLFMSIAQGLNWETPVESLWDVSGVAVAMIFIYIIVTWRLDGSMHVPGDHLCHPQCNWAAKCFQWEGRRAESA